MQNKEDIRFDFDKLPEDAKAEVSKHLPIRTLINLTSISKNYFELYNKSNLLFKPIYDLGTFQYFAVRRCDEQLKEILKNNIHFICKKGTFTDLSHRTFDNISAFEYAFWAKDKHFWTLMLERIPHNEVGIAIIKELIIQLDNIEKNGITYELKVKTTTSEFDIKTITETHFDFDNTIIKELQEYVNMVNKSKVNWVEADKQWVTGVGQAQKLFPMHVVHEYCADRAFDPVPDFKVAPKELKQQFNNYKSNKNENWFDVDSELGSVVAIYKAERGARGVWGVFVALAGAGLDLAAMKALCEERTQDCHNLKSQLEALLLTITQSLENQPCLNG